MALCVVNIGNTRVQSGLWQDGAIRDVRQVPRGQFRADMIPAGLPVAAATVVPTAKAMLADRHPLWVGPGLGTGLDTSLVDMATFGADRLANAVALAAVAPDLPAICLDCGTAITAEAVDAHRALRGGAIAPGRQLLRRALHEHTAQLPLLDFVPGAPPEIGTNTRDAIRCGIDRGVLGAVGEIIAGIRRELGVDACPCLVTGGDAEFFTERLPALTFAGLDFTLRGIAAIWEINHAR